MKNCSVKKYSSVAENNNLEYFGYVKARVKNATLRFTQGCKLVVLDGKWSANNSKEILVDANTTIYPTLKNSSGAHYIIPNAQEQEFATILIPKYSCYYYGNVFPETDGLPVYCTGYKYIASSDVTDILLNFSSVISSADADAGKLTVSGINYAPLAKARIFLCNNIRFAEPVDVTQLGADGLLNSLGFKNCGQWNDMYGTLDNLGMCNLTSIELPSAPNVSLDLSNFINNHKSKGRNSGTVTLIRGSIVTIKNGDTVIPVPYGSSSVLTWVSGESTFTFRGETYPLLS